MDPLPRSWPEEGHFNTRHTYALIDFCGVAAVKARILRC